MKIGKILMKASLSLTAAVLLIFTAFYIYTLNDYEADAFIRDIAAEETGSLEKRDRYTLIYPAAENDRKTALIFYPGGKVQDTAYLPLLIKLSEKGITCVLVKMPFNLAVFGIDAADDVYGMLPDIENWYIGGHSLGGAMAGAYAEKNAGRLSGLILLAAYPAGSPDIPAIAVYGSEDLILDRSEISGDTEIIVIQGGNHAGFGYYGDQKGDGTASLTREEQQLRAAQAVFGFINGSKG